MLETEKLARQRSKLQLLSQIGTAGNWHSSPMIRGGIIPWIYNDLQTSSSERVLCVGGRVQETNGRTSTS
jgi:hypothetical protein